MVILNVVCIIETTSGSILDVSMEYRVCQLYNVCTMEHRALGNNVLSF